MHQYPTFILS